ncbi:alpha/beta hydrolase [Nocardioides koreensis]|uniref:alpha/beta fold hydrolase n=1 Tax=Nocardioides koreensis TaxID=433651 RepID=UPI0031D76E3E
MATAATLLVSGCSDDSSSSSSTGDGDSSSGASPTATRAGSSETTGAGLSGSIDVGGRSLQLTCNGLGAPTILLEGGEGQPGGALAAIRTAYEAKHLVCTYDRANVGASDPAPTPRKATAMTADLHRLLRQADVPGDYVLVGTSAGGLLVQAYARAYPDEVAGVVALNPVPPWDQWSTLGLREMSPQERTGEKAYYAGENGESLDYRDLSAAVAAAPAPPGVPFHLVISTIAQCESPHDVCSRTYPAYEKIMRAVSQQWPGGKIDEVQAGHEIHLDNLPAVQAAVDDVLSR